jgi:CHAT domain-containing protein
MVEHCGLYFVSACETDTSKHLALRDENVHIAGSLQMAGVLSAIASMWSVADDVCRTLADTFYTELTRENSPKGKRGISIAEAPFTLHAAIQHLRKIKSTPPILWGAWFHAGV